ncbi:MAG: Holliday junction resolvase RuvX [Burkholderiales bacterium]
MSRIIAIDYGLRRVGLAVTDPLQYIATPLITVPTSEILNYLKKYLEQEEVEAFVIGMPYRLDGQVSLLMDPIKQFAGQLKKFFPSKPIFQQDERYTSKLAAASMLEAGFKKKDRRNKSHLDKLSATIILQSFLNSYKRTSI